jgi:hypothetical protein
MDVNKFMLLVVGTVAAVLSGSAHAACPSDGAANCVKQELFNQLSTSDPTNYCQQGAILAGDAVKCLDDCLSPGASTFLNNQVKKIETFCSQASPNCPAVVGTYVNQTKCFDGYEGLELLLPEILRRFQIRQSNAEKCQDLFWGRSCMRIQSCKYNANLYLYLVAKNPNIVLCLSVCGSEDVTKLAPVLEKKDTCSQTLFDKIKKDCNIGVQIAAATVKEQVCPLLETQAACIENLSKGCSEATKLYLVPRLDTYAMANQYLGCNVKCNDIKVQPQIVCDYTKVLKTCFYRDTIENSLQYSLLSLINRDLPVMGFCQNLKNITEQLRQCKLTLLSCIVPNSRLYVPANTYDESYAPEMGAFPLNLWGMNSIFNWLNGFCKPDQRWSDVIYNAPVETVPTVKTTKKTTPQPKTTPKPEMRVPTPTIKGGNKVGSLEGNFPSTSKGNKVVMSFMLAVLSALTVNLMLKANFIM